MTKLDVSDDPRLKGKIIDAEHQRTAKRIERGAMGWLLGLGPEKPGNLVAFAIVVACLMILAIGLCNFHESVPRRELIMLFASMIPGAMGYYFGYLTGSAKKSDD